MATQEPRDFADPSASDFAVAIMGDLHLPSNAADMGLFLEARDQLVGMARQDSAAARLVQLGDLGSYERGWPGSAACFARAGDFLTGFNLPTGLILGNHDLEGDDFDTDEANLAAWQEAFQQRHFWSARLGPALLIGLSTTRFRSNPYSVHEVHVDDEQLAFFEAALKEAGDRPVIVFSHAPILGSGLKVVQAVHVKNRCAWLNHSSNPQRFMQLVQAHPNIKLWMSGHFHLSQNYPGAPQTVSLLHILQMISQSHQPETLIMAPWVLTNPLRFPTVFFFSQIMCHFISNPPSPFCNPVKPCRQHFLGWRHGLCVDWRHRRLFLPGWSPPQPPAARQRRGLRAVHGRPRRRQHTTGSAREVE